MLAQPDTAPREASPELSEGLSSSLSELDYLPEEPKSPEEAGSEDAADSENDTEAETERLDPSPNKPPRPPGGETIVDVMDDTKDANVDAEGDGDDEPTLKRSLLNEEDLANVTRNQHIVDAEIRSPTSTAGTKRKRSSSLTEPGDDKLSDLEPPRKRPSTQMAGSTLETAELEEPAHDIPAMASEVAPHEQTDGIPDPHADEVQAEPRTDSEEALANHAPTRRKSKRRQAEDPQEDDPVEASGTNGGTEGPVEAEPEEEQAHPDDEDVDATAHEDESAFKNRFSGFSIEEFANSELVARKKDAFEALAPIEEQFAIFRDKYVTAQISSFHLELS